MKQSFYSPKMNRLLLFIIGLVPAAICLIFMVAALLSRDAYAMTKAGLWTFFVGGAGLLAMIHALRPKLRYKRGTWIITVPLSTATRLKPDRVRRVELGKQNVRFHLKGGKVESVPYKSLGEEDLARLKALLDDLENPPKAALVVAEAPDDSEEEAEEEASSTAVP